MMNGRLVLTLCGSVRFKPTFEEVCEDLSAKGIVILTLALWGEGKLGYVGDDHSLKEVLEEEHFARIDLSDGIYVIDCGINKNDGEWESHLGNSTLKEIAYAEKQHKSIQFHSQVKSLKAV